MIEIKNSIAPVKNSLKERGHSCKWIRRVKRGDTKMGVSGSILKRKDDIDIERLINDINLAANRAGLETTMDEKVYSEDRKSLNT